MQKALTTLEFLSQDDQARRLYEARQKALHDYASAIGDATEKGMEKGMEKGRHEGRKEGLKEASLEFARKLLAEGESPERVAHLTGLSLAEIKQLVPTD